MATRGSYWGKHCFWTLKNNFLRHWPFHSLSIDINLIRTHTLLERLTDDISYNANDHAGTAITLDVPYVNERLASLAKNTDLSRFVL